MEEATDEYSGFDRRSWNQRWDYAFVFPVASDTESLTEEQAKFSLQNVIIRLRGAGLITKMFLSCNRDKVFVKVQAPYERLLQFADSENMLLPVDEITARDVITKPKLVYNPSSQRLEESASGEMEGHVPANTTSIPPFRHLYAKYDRDPAQQRLYLRHAPYGLFRSIDRLKLVLQVIRAPHSRSAARDERPTGAGLDPERMFLSRAIVGFFALHEQETCAQLRRRWMRWAAPPWKQPIETGIDGVGARDYFGEKIALYFAWLGHYTTWLLGASIVGAVTFLIQFMHRTNDSIVLVPCAVFTMSWAVLFQETWTRKQSTMVMRWGVKDYEEMEQKRPAFRGTFAKSAVTGKGILVANELFQRLRRVVSTSVISLAVGCVMAVTVGIMVFRVYATRVNPITIGGVNIGGQLAAMLNAITIQVMNRIYSTVALKLNDYENHPTDTSYEDSLVAKVFAFQFVNSNASLFYIAFVKGHVPLLGEDTQCANGSCMQELAQQLGIIFATQIVVNNAFEVGLPFFKQWFHEKRRRSHQHLDSGDVEMTAVRTRPSSGASSHTTGSAVQPPGRSAVEAQLDLVRPPPRPCNPASFPHQPPLPASQDPYDGQSLFSDYAEMAISFGYCTLFVASFPLAPLLALLNNYIEIRVDAFKLTAESRRPLPMGAQDIGTWARILELITQLSIMTNLGLICFTSTILDGHPMSHRLIVFLLVEHILLALRYVLTLLLDDVPRDVAVQMGRQDHIVRRVLNLIKGIPEDDDEEDEVEATHGVKGAFSPQHQPFRASGYPEEWFSLLSADR